jgi:hypothetical protein
MTSPTTTPAAPAAADAFTPAGLATLIWFLRDRVRDAHAAGHPHAQLLQDSIEDAVCGILDYTDQAAHTADPLVIAPARARAHALWAGLKTAAGFWHDHPNHPDQEPAPAEHAPRLSYTTAS